MVGMGSNNLPTTIACRQKTKHFTDGRLCAVHARCDSVGSSRIRLSRAGL